MSNELDFPVYMNPTMQRFCTQLSEENGCPIRLLPNPEGALGLKLGNDFDTESDTQFSIGDSGLVIANELVEGLQGWKLIGIESVFDDFGFYPLPPGYESSASDPGLLSMDRKLLVQLEPELRGEKAQGWKEQDQKNGTFRFENSIVAISEHLFRGDTRAAIVIQVSPVVLVAAYTDELDCVAVLEFATDVATRFQLKTGTRLVTNNQYMQLENGIANDLLPGVDGDSNWQNFHPIISEFLTEDVDRLRELKEGISQDEWLRTAQLGKEWLERHCGGETFPRKGDPLISNRPAIPPLASVKRRLAAMTIDMLMLTAIVATIWWFAFDLRDAFWNYVKNPGQGPERVVFMKVRNTVRDTATLAYLFYCPILLATSWQATLGKRLLNLRVVAQRGNARLNPGQALTRTLWFLPSIGFGTLGCIAACFSDKNQAWHDERAGTLVIHDKQQSR